MATALLNVLPAPVVEHVLAFVPIDRDNLCGTTTIDGVKHFVTYGGGPEGGYVYLPGKGEPLASGASGQGWHKWRRDWYQEAIYNKVEHGQVAFLINADGSEEIAVIPFDWGDEAYDLAETVIFADDAFMEEFD